jgi:hypothetical protein
MRKHARKDDNQDEMRDAAHELGATTLTIHQLGDGAPDIIIGTEGLTIVGRLGVHEEAFIDLASKLGYRIYTGANIMVEIKDGAKPPGKRRLTPDEEKWHESWRGQKTIWARIDQVVKGLGF